MYFSSQATSSISYDRLTSKYIVTHGTHRIETTVTDKSSVTDAWVRDIQSIHRGENKIVAGLDVEWKPHHISWMSNKSATLQICIDAKCLILQLFYMDEIPQSLKSFMSDSNVTFVGIEVGDDVAKLRDEYGLNCASHADIRAMAKDRWPGRFRRPGLKDLALEVANVYMKKPKHVCLSNWEARVLNEQQIEYACILMLMLHTKLAISCSKRTSYLDMDL